MKQGLLLINIGTPEHPDTLSVGSFLREFLLDKRVIDIPMIFRYLLVYGVILPFRAKKSARAYQAIWTSEGSPLRCISQLVVDKLQEKTEPHYKIALGMRYGNPSIHSALDELKDCEALTILPLYPQYSSAANGSALEAVFNYFATQETIPSIKIISDFYHHPAYIDAQAQLIKDNLGNHEHLIFSYHGVPERQIKRGGCQTVCSSICPPSLEHNLKCYKAQCHQTSLLLAQKLKLKSSEYTTSFQSRLGKTPWITPSTDSVLDNLIEQGIHNIAVVCPSFVTDCLETLEEIGIRAKEKWMSLGGKQFTLIPCLNADSRWVNAIKELI